MYIHTNVRIHIYMKYIRMYTVFPNLVVLSDGHQ